MKHFKTIETYSQYNFNEIQARHYSVEGGIVYYAIPVGTVFNGAELVNNGTPFIGYVVMFQDKQMFIRSQDAREL